MLRNVLLRMNELQQRCRQLNAKVHKACGVRPEQDLRAAVAVNDAIPGVKRQHRSW